MTRSAPACGACGARMLIHQVAPCLDCGGDPRELGDWRSGYHAYEVVGLFDGETLCDFCVADMPSTDPLFWGFPPGFRWGEELECHSWERLAEAPPLRTEFACPTCHNTLRKQDFIRRNADRRGVVLPATYWPYLNARI
jgi:hypothetical protein